jgi:preprotein translocase subunit SecA
MRMFTSPQITKFLQRFRPPEGEALTAKILNKSIETAQKRVEQRNCTIRKHTLEYDDVMNRQRTEIYSFRNDVLKLDDLMPLIFDIFESVCCQMSEKFFTSRTSEGGWDPEGYRKWLMTHFPITFTPEQFDNDYLSLEEIENIAITKVCEVFSHKMENEKARIQKMQEYLPPQTTRSSPDAILKGILRNILIFNIDRRWQEHLLHIDHLRTEVHLRAVGQKDPLLEFKHEAFALFDAFSLRIKLEIAHALFKFEVAAPPQERIAPPPIEPFRFNLSLMPEIEEEIPS